MFLPWFSGECRLLTSLALAAALSLTSGRARADGPGLQANAAAAYGYIVVGSMVGEALIPDLRLEYADSRYYGILSFPVHVRLLRAERSLFELSTFAEPQWRPASGEFRQLLGLRSILKLGGPWGLIGEGAGLLGTDGHGGMLGGGPTLILRDEELCFGGLAVVYRHTILVDAQRDDISLDALFFLF